MKLSDYLADKGITETAFAALVGVDQSTVHRLRAKGQIPNKDLMALIFEKTDGHVTANDFFDIAPSERTAA